MSLQINCSECGNECGYFTGRNVRVGSLDPEEGNETDNIYAVGKVKGHAGVTFQDLKTVCEVFICGNCLKTKMPNAFNSIKEHPEYKSHDNL